MKNLILFLAIAAVACGGEKEKTVHASYKVEIKGMKFQPAVLNVQKGDTITWINNDFVDHDVVEESSKEWRSPVLNPGKSWSKVADKSADYYCSVHMVMKGKVVVQQ
jgi:plastocyanin